jgi:hypothetical protein
VPLASLVDLDEVFWEDPLTVRQAISHLRRILQADLSCPIILSASGHVMDGYHRIAKAIIDGHTDILAVQFNWDPPPDDPDPTVEQRIKDLKQQGHTLESCARTLLDEAQVASYNAQLAPAWQQFMEDTRQAEKVFQKALEAPWARFQAAEPTRTRLEQYVDEVGPVHKTYDAAQQEAWAKLEAVRYSLICDLYGRASHETTGTVPDKT